MLKIILLVDKEDAHQSLCTGLSGPALGSTVPLGSWAFVVVQLPPCSPSTAVSSSLKTDLTGLDVSDGVIGTG